MRAAGILLVLLQLCCCCTSPGGPLVVQAAAVDVASPQLQQQHVQEQQQQQHVPDRFVKQQHRRHLLHHPPVEQPGRVREWLQSSNWTQTYAGDSCFPSGTVHKAVNTTGRSIVRGFLAPRHPCTHLTPSACPCVPGLVLPAEWMRLVSDPAVRQIQLTGDIAFSPDLFPPEQSNDKNRGVNVSHKVSPAAARAAWLACQGQVQAARFQGMYEQPAQALRRCDRQGKAMKATDNAGDRGVCACVCACRLK